MKAQAKFKTILGFCHIFSDKLILSSYKKIDNSNISKIEQIGLYNLIILGISIGISSSCTTIYLSENNYQISILCIFILFASTLGIIWQMKHIAPIAINKSEIISVNFIEGNILQPDKLQIQLKSQDGSNTNKDIYLPKKLSQSSEGVSFILELLRPNKTDSK
ncbi:MAG: hypothetical protein ACEPOW_09575 [Bacteroidales bacterium]